MISGGQSWSIKTYVKSLFTIYTFKFSLCTLRNSKKTDFGIFISSLLSVLQYPRTLLSPRILSPPWVLQFTHTKVEFKDEMVNCGHRNLVLELERFGVEEVDVFTFTIKREVSRRTITTPRLCKHDVRGLGARPDSHRRSVV